MTNEELSKLIDGRMEELGELMKEFELEGDNASYDYASGAYDAYDIVRMNLTV